MRGGFVAGAIGGLAIALILVGLVAAFPQANPSIPATSTLPQESSAVAGGPALVVPGAAGEPAPLVKASVATVQRPDSLLAVIPGEGAASLVGTVSPLLIGLLVAALVYAAYSRRQDASS